jgi:hypothetical protein
MDTQMDKGWLHRKSFRVYQTGFKLQPVSHDLITNTLYLFVYILIYIFILSYPPRLDPSEPRQDTEIVVAR